MLISWNTTKECNLSCPHCYRDAGPKDKGELTTPEGEHLLEEIKKAGFQIVILSGGEPLLRKDIYHLIAYARQIGLRPVLGSNGTLIDIETAKKLKRAGLARAGISLDSANPFRHDKFRGKGGSWQRSVEGMKNCKNVGLEFQIHTTVTKFNSNELDKLADLAQALGAVAHHLFFLVPVGRAKEMEEEIKRKASDHEKLLCQILEKGKTLDIQTKITCAPQFMRIAKEMGINMPYKRGCLAGISYGVILPNGDLHPCPYLPLRLGNVKEDGFLNIWQNSKVLKKLREAELKDDCGICRYKKICGGCRARAYFYSDGDYLAQDPWCAYGQIKK